MASSSQSAGTNPWAPSVPETVERVVGPVAPVAPLDPAVWRVGVELPVLELVPAVPPSGSPFTGAGSAKPHAVSAPAKDRTKPKLRQEADRRWGLMLRS